MFRLVQIKKKTAIDPKNSNLSSMPYSHTDNLAILAATAGIHDGLDYSNHDPLNLVENYFQFCQQNLSEECEEYNLHGARIYIRALMDVNARAGRPNGHPVISVNFGTLPELFRLFTNHDNVFEHEAFDEYTELNAATDLPLDILMFQVCTQFTYYHELAHLIQLTPEPHNWIEEAYHHTDDADVPFNLNRHLHEFDADLNGSSYAVNHLIDYWKKLPEAARTEQNIGLILSMGISAIFSYYLFILQRYQRMYYEASTHPHPLVRISYILDNAVRHAEINLPEGIHLDSAEILRRAFRISDTMFTLIGLNRVEPFAEMFQQESNGITAFVNGVLIPGSRQLPNLVMNRFAGPHA
jgi:hypothetical protein